MVGHIRTIKPDFFLDEDLAKLPAMHRLLFVGLWCYADRAGRLEDRPAKLKVQIFPYDKIDVDKALSDLQPKFITRYNVNGRNYLQIRNFIKHQRPHHTERDSTIPAFQGEIPVSSPLPHLSYPEGREGKGKEGKGSNILDATVTSPLDHGASTASPKQADIDPFVLGILQECPHLQRLKDEEDFWDHFLASIEPYRLDKHWLNARLRKWNQWFEDNPARRSKSVRGLRSRLMAWLGKDLERIARGG